MSFSTARHQAETAANLTQDESVRAIAQALAEISSTLSRELHTINQKLDQLQFQTRR